LHNVLCTEIADMSLHRKVFKIALCTTVHATLGNVFLFTLKMEEEMLID